MNRKSSQLKKNLRNYLSYFIKPAGAVQLKQKDVDIYVEDTNIPD